MSNCVKRVENNVGTFNDVCFIFSCPGEKELNANRPCAGTTGKNLDILINEAAVLSPTIFKSYNRYDYFIGNSSTIVHYKKFDGRTEPKDIELEKENDVLKSFIIKSGCKNIILFGKKAQKAYELTKITTNSINMPHLGFFGLIFAFMYVGNIIFKNKNEKLKSLAKYMIDKLV